MPTWPWRHNPKGRDRDGPLDFWDLSRPVLAYGNSPVTLSNLTQGIQVFGQPGSGKTTGSGRFFLEQFMRLGMGGLILTAKEDDTRLYRKYARLFGREQQLAVFSAGAPSDSAAESDSPPQYTFNPFQWEYSRPSQGAGHAANLTSLFTVLLDIMERKPGQKGGEDGVFWNRSLELLLTNAIDLVILALDRISVEDLYAVVNSTAPTREGASTEGWRANSYNYHLLELGKAKHESMTRRQQRDFEMTATFFLEDWPSLSPRTRSVVTTMFTGMADKLMRGTVGDLLNDQSSSKSLPPEFALEGGIIVLGLPAREYGAVGLMVQAAYKFCFQRALETRDLDKNPRPCFLYVDESPLFVNEQDAEFLRTARSKLACVMLLAQDVSSYYASGMRREAVDSLLANTAMKLFHLNGDPVTNEWAAQCIAKNLISRPSVHATNSNDFSLGGRTSSVTVNESMDYEPGVAPRDFQNLACGTPRWNWMVEAIAFSAGRRWESTVKNYTKVAFQQYPFE